MVRAQQLKPTCLVEQVCETGYRSWINSLRVDKDDDDDIDNDNDEDECLVNMLCLYDILIFCYQLF